MEHKPSLFVASSVEHLNAAYAVQNNLEYAAEVTVWPQGVFKLSQSAIESLIDLKDKMDFGVFIFGPDDILKWHNAEYKAVRDNVLFELGLFIGKLGRERNFIVCPNQVEDFHLPTDLIGMTPAKYDAHRSDDNLQAALGPACNEIRTAIQKLGFFSSNHIVALVEPEPEATDYDDNDCVLLLQRWLQPYANQDERVFNFADVDREIGLPTGTAKRLLEVAAREFFWKVQMKGERTIGFEFDGDAYSRNLQVGTRSGSWIPSLW